jgi:hypothetical protein
MIPSIILEEAKTFVTFMQSMVEELIGNEEVMLAIARASGNHIEGYGDDTSDTTSDDKSETVQEGIDEDEDDDYRRYKEYMDSKAGE